ncbi:MAG: amidase [Gemmatimonadota bacterium]|nr:amidase [Gemmatimonadota bacterium]
MSGAGGTRPAGSTGKDTNPEGPQPLDEQVSRRWFLSRMAWVSSAAAAGTLFARRPGVASPRGPVVTDEAFEGSVRLQDVGELTELTLSEAMTLVRNGTLSPVDLVEAYVDRIDAYDEAFYQAYAARPDREEVLARAERIPSGGRDAPLRGIGIAPKDNYYTADLLTEGGSLVFEGFQPDYDATVISHFRSAGAVVLGKAQMGNLAGGRARRYGTTTPTTRNAWVPDDVRYSPGGSSSGTATAIAGRLALAGVGTQTGGSVIGPGNAQGLTCIKPTFGRISLHGIIPLSYTRDHVGPMARNAKDAAIVLQTLAQPDPLDPRTLGLPRPPNYALAASPFGGDRPRVRWPTRVGVWPDYLSSDDERTNELRRDLVEYLDGTPGVTVVPDVTLPDDFETLTSSPLGGSHGDPTAFFIQHLRRDVRLFADRLPRFLNGMLQSADTYVKVQQARQLLLDRLISQLFNQCDVVLTASTGAFDGTGLPLMCFPIGFDTDDETGRRVPRGAVLAGAPFAEERLLAVVAAYQAATDFHAQRPEDPA